MMALPHRSGGESGPLLPPFFHQYRCAPYRLHRAAHGYEAYLFVATPRSAIVRVGIRADSWGTRCEQMLDVLLDETGPMPEAEHICLTDILVDSP